MCYWVSRVAGGGVLEEKWPDSYQFNQFNGVDLAPLICYTSNRQ